MALDHDLSRDALIHVLTNVWQVQDDHPLTLSLQEHGFHDIYAILDASKEDIKALTYTDCQGNVVDLSWNHKGMIHLLRSYNRVQLGHWPSYSKDRAWMTVTAQDFDDLCDLCGFESKSFIRSLQLSI
jgi:hypothetical protein